MCCALRVMHGRQRQAKFSLQLPGADVAMDSATLLCIAYRPQGAGARKATLISCFGGRKQ